MSPRFLQPLGDGWTENEVVGTILATYDHLVSWSPGRDGEWEHEGCHGNIAICDMIERNESDVGDVVFEILAKAMLTFLCFMLFLALSNPS